MPGRQLTDEEILAGTAAPDDDVIRALAAEESAPAPEAPPPSPRDELHTLVAQRPQQAHEVDPFSALTSKSYDTPITGGQLAGSIFMSLLGGGGADTLEGIRNRNVARGKDLALAKAKDLELQRMQSPVDAATAETLVRSGVTPGAAAATTRDSDVLKMVYPGLNDTAAQRREDARWREKMADLESRERIAGERNETTLERQRLANAGRGKKKAGAGGGGGGPADTSIADMKAVFLAQQANLPTSEVRTYLETGFAPEGKEDVLAAQGQFYDWLGKNDKKKFATLINDVAKREATRPDKQEDAVALQQMNVEKRFKHGQELASLNSMLSQASQAWKSMTPDERQKFVQFGISDNWSGQALKGIFGNDAKAKAKASPLMALINSTLKSRSGSAVTDSEYGRFAAESGTTASPFSTVADMATFQAWLNGQGELFRAGLKPLGNAYPGLIEETLGKR